MLTKKEFAEVVKKVPIVAVDLIIENSDGEILLGKRNNNPAKGYLFTFGGAILKNEKISSAIERVSLNELNFRLKLKSLVMINVFEFFYSNNFLNNYEFSTHYIVLSFHYKDFEDRISPVVTNKDGNYYKQHSDIKWMKPEALFGSPIVHNDCKTMIHYMLSRYNIKGNLNQLRIE